MRTGMENYPEISFIGGITFDQFLDEMLKNYTTKYKELTGKEAVLASASPERLQLYSCALILYQAMQQIDRAGKNGLLKYSTGEYLDNLAALKHVIRNPAQPSLTVMKFSLSKPQTFPIEIPAGTRVKIDELFFATEETAIIEPGEESKEVKAKCLEPGSGGNGYQPGRITTLVDPINYMGQVVNVTETSGGSDEESDDELAERVYLAPSSYSTAGPEDAYRYWVNTYNQSIADCYITSETPGEVDVYVMFQNGKIPDMEQTKALETYLQEGSKKPLTDKVVVKVPQLNEYDIDATYYIEDSDREKEEGIKEKVEDACTAYQEWQQAVIGRDINPSRLIYLLVQAGASYVDVRAPTFQEITDPKISKARHVTLIYGGIKDEKTL